MLIIFGILIFCLFITFWIMLFVCSERVTDLEYHIGELETRLKELEKHVYIIPGDDGK